MPELPEVETVVRSLKPLITNKTIREIIFSGAKFRAKELKLDIKSLINCKIERVLRKAKYILLNLNNKKILILHLGMTGKILYPANKNSSLHDHLQIIFDDETKLVFNDVRRFGTLKIIDNADLDNDVLFKNLGIEPLEDFFNECALANICKNRKTNIKSLLMNSNLIVGVGNIYASESLFRAKIHPLRFGNDINLKEIKLLVDSIKAVLNDAIESGGSTLRNYVRSDGQKGGFQHRFNVYGKNGKPCMKCNSTIKKIVIAGRSTFFCPKCQK